MHSHFGLSVFVLSVVACDRSPAAPVPNPPPFVVAATSASSSSTTPVMPETWFVTRNEALAMVDALPEVKAYRETTVVEEKKTNRVDVVMRVVRDADEVGVPEYAELLDAKERLLDPKPGICCEVGPKKRFVRV